MLRLNHIISTSLNPYHNLALEETLLNNISSDQGILFLWQNKNTVVIGKNQNALSECRLNELEEDKGYLARRLSGGGAVYHDLGNLNFTFLATKEKYNVEKQLNVILRALRKMGLNGEKTGRNDLTIDGKKFSGNAFYERKNKCFHHGTLLVDVNMQDMAKYLSVSQDKLESNGVKSVKARVVNLNELNKEIGIKNLTENLISAYSEEYGSISNQIFEDDLDIESILELTRKYKSIEWKLGKNIHHTFEISDRFAWGGMNLRLKIKSEKIIDAQIFSDALEYDLLEKISENLKGKTFSKDSIVACLNSMMNSVSNDQSVIISDIISSVKNSFEG